MDARVRETDRSSSTAVVLVRPQEPGNVGAAARAMANLGLSRLILVDPAPPIGATARAFAVGAGFVLDAIERRTSLAEALAPFRRVVGTTSARDRALGIPLVEPREMARRLAGDPPPTPTALVFGPEASGLTNDELRLCDLLVTIPASPIQPTFNLAQAVLILCYERFLAAEPPLDAAATEPAGAASAAGAAPHGAVEGAFSQWTELLVAGGFARDSSFASAAADLRAFLGRARPTDREVTLLRGIARRLRGRMTAAAKPGGRPTG
jgi:tRNA/rRNA methyltransferase